MDKKGLQEKLDQKIKKLQETVEATRVKQLELSQLMEAQVGLQYQISLLKEQIAEIDKKEKKS